MNPPRKVHGVVKQLAEKNVDERPFPDQIECIERHGQVTTSAQLRTALLGGLQLRANGSPRNAENVIHIGCYCWGTALAIVSYCRLLQHFDEQYVFLNKEHCCAAGVMVGAEVRGNDEERKAAADASAHYLGLNIAQAAKMGAKRMYYCCTWCGYLGRRFHENSVVSQRYYMDHVVEVIERRKPKLRLDATVAYFPGGQHRRTFYVPGIKWNFDWPSYRRILDQIDGLRVIDLPKYCCVTHPEAITAALERECISLMVTPCMTCYGRMMRKVPAGVRVVTIPELLLEAMGRGVPAHGGSAL